MSLDIDTVKNIAMLARIRVADDELDHLAGELSHILGWVEQLNEVDTKGVEPMSSIVEISLPRRSDEVVQGGESERVLANAPDAKDGFFTVPKVME